MTIEKLIEQMESIRDNSESFICEDSDIVWEEDVTACDVVIDLLQDMINTRREYGDTLRHYIDLLGVDDIEDDQKFVEAEYEAIHDYCLNHKFLLTEDDMRVVYERGLVECFEDWSVSCE